ncbi:MAG: HAMP domain-containing histidine kinase [Gemmatimonadetes bacterium]|nr:HAMP domain-containing histidine kinase [Gemmatimonadota bacterium]
MRRSAPVVLVAAALLALLGSYVWYTQRVVAELSREARVTAQVFSRVYQAASRPDRAGPAPADADVLLDVLGALQDLGVPIIVTDSAGRPTAASNLPFEHDGVGDPRVAAYVATLDRDNAPVGDSTFQLVHFGETPLVRGLQVIPLLQVALVVTLIIAGAAALRVRSRAERERVWAGMAREAAHQLGTPLSSLHGWVELLNEAPSAETVQTAVPHIAGDVERLERVAHRFERIGRPAKRDAIDVADVVDQVAAYYRARLPSLANAITIRVNRPETALPVPGDRVLLEWAIESLVKNAVDALAAGGGQIELTVAPAAGSGAMIRIADNGPGIPKDLRKRIFAAGFSTKERGWGIGLPLARRIVTESHGGRLALAPSEKGAVFELILPG